MARTVLAAGPQIRVSLLLRTGATSALSATIHTDLAGFPDDDPELVVECAGHGAVRDDGSAVLESGRELTVISVGALADDALRASLQQAARRGGVQLRL